MYCAQWTAPRWVKAEYVELFTFPFWDMIFGLGGRDYPAYLWGFHSSTAASCPFTDETAVFLFSFFPSHSLWLLRAKQMSLAIQTHPKQHNRGENSHLLREFIYRQSQWGIKRNKSERQQFFSGPWKVFSMLQSNEKYSLICYLTTNFQNIVSRSDSNRILSTRAAAHRKPVRVLQ